MPNIFIRHTTESDFPIGRTLNLIADRDLRDVEKQLPDGVGAAIKYAIRLVAGDAEFLGVKTFGEYLEKINQFNLPPVTERPKPKESLSSVTRY